MRLIDADKLHYVQAKIGIKKLTVVRAKEINQASEVRAIPIDWLTEKLTNHPELSYAVTDGIQNILDLWEQEEENE